jgi:hypothetical protein
MSMNKQLEADTRKRRLDWKNACRRLDDYSTSSGVLLTPDDIESLASELNAQGWELNEVQVKVFHENILTTLQTTLTYGKLVGLPLLVNTISDNFPLDALKSGAAGTEFDILRATNLYSSMKEEMFPLRETLLYSPGVTLLKSGKKFSCLTMVLPRHPKLISHRIDGVTKEDYENEKDREAIRDKIRAVFLVAHKYQHSCLIFPDFGCGSDGHPSQQITEMLNAEIELYRIKYVLISARKEEKISRDESFLALHKGIVRCHPGLEEPEELEELEDHEEE